MSAHKNSKKRLALCKGRALRILDVLQSRKWNFDVVELEHICRFTNCVLSDFLRTKRKDRPTLDDEGKELEAALKSGEDFLNELPQTTKFVRRKWDTIITQIYHEAYSIYLGLQHLSNKGAKDGNQELEAEAEIQKQLQSLKDEDARQFWRVTFNNKVQIEHTSECNWMYPESDFILSVSWPSGHFWWKRFSTRQPRRLNSTNN